MTIKKFISTGLAGLAALVGVAGCAHVPANAEIPTIEMKFAEPEGWACKWYESEVRLVKEFNKQKMKYHCKNGKPFGVQRVFDERGGIGGSVYVYDADGKVTRSILYWPNGKKMSEHIYIPEIKPNSGNMLPEEDYYEKATGIDCKWSEYGDVIKADMYINGSKKADKQILDICKDRQ